MTQPMTPMMRQYLGVKEQHPDAILFFRLGDFYEMFFEDAERAARELEIVLTARDGGDGVRVPMCGVPFHAAEGYIAKLVEKGYKVAICEQVEDPRSARGLVKREVVRVVTPGTFLDNRLVGEKRNNFICAVVGGQDRQGTVHGLAFADVSTGEFQVTEFANKDGERSLMDELSRLRPSECILDGSAPRQERIERYLRDTLHAPVTIVPSDIDSDEAHARLRRHFRTLSLSGFGIEGQDQAVRAAALLLDYIEEVHRDALPQMTSLRLYARGEYMTLDSATRRNLELVARVADGQRQGSLLAVLDFTVTAMGGRLLHQSIERPLVKLDAINARLAAVQELVGDSFLRADLREVLKGVYDLERLGARVACRSANPRDLVALKNSLQRLPALQSLLRGCRASELSCRLPDMAALNGVTELISRAITDDPPPSVSEGNVIRTGYNAEVDALRQAQLEGKGWIASLEAAERERTGIKSLRVGFNKVFGYYIEVTNANRHLIPDDYQRRQTLANCERYITQALKEKEDLVLGAEDRLAALELSLFSEVRELVGQHIGSIQQAAREVAMVDMLASLAEAAVRYGYNRPEFVEGEELVIREGRHPVLERVLQPGGFVPNDAVLDCSGNRLLLITGPNMAGKSTFARQVALTVIMAQIGGFVPAEQCRLGVVDRVFTRIGAGDDLFSGESTFMVEMQEVANILNNATGKSLVVLDEVGRGTSTFDGLSIAWAVSEYLHDRIGCKTIFTTHYHELTKLEEIRSGVRNLSVAVLEKGDEVVFLHKVTGGKADRSYGIQVARLAGLPGSVLERAMEVLKGLEQGGKMEGRVQRGFKTGQLALLPAVGQLRVLRELLDLDLANLTPIEALNKLYELQGMASGNGDQGFDRKSAHT